MDVQMHLSRLRQLGRTVNAAPAELLSLSLSLSLFLIGYTEAAGPSWLALTRDALAWFQAHSPDLLPDARAELMLPFAAQFITRRSKLWGKYVRRAGDAYA